MAFWNATSWSRLAWYHTPRWSTTPSNTARRTVLREEGGVDLAEVGAVGEAVEVDLLGAQRLADGVQVLGGVRGGEVRQQRAALLRAGRGVALGPRLPRRHHAGRLRRVVLGTVVAAVVGDAGQRGLARADAAGVEADPVVGVARVLGHGAAEQGERAPRAARPARVDQHRALRLGVGDLVLHPRHRDLDLLAARPRVVQRSGDEPALRPARERRFRARTPGDGRRLVIRRRRGLRHRCRDRQSDDGGQHGQREATHFSPTPPMWTESEIAIRVRPGQPPRRAVLGHNGCLLPGGVPREAGGRGSSSGRALVPRRHRPDPDARAGVRSGGRRARGARARQPLDRPLLRAPHARAAVALPGDRPGHARLRRLRARPARRHPRARRLGRRHRRPPPRARRDRAAAPGGLVDRRRGDRAVRARPAGRRR